MILPISDTVTVADLQDRFSQTFPGLRIQFFKKPCTYTDTCLVDNRAEGQVPLRQLRKSNVPGIMEVMSWYTTARLEKEFRIRFGLYVQVFRKENSGWKQIRDTDTCPLWEQSERAQRATQLNAYRLKKHYPEYEYL